MRPNSKRICKLIQGRYGKSRVSINQELNLLVKKGELSKVDNKGSISFRVANKDNWPKLNWQVVKRNRKKKPAAIESSAIDRSSGNKLFPSAPWQLTGTLMLYITPMLFLWDCSCKCNWVSSR